MFDVDARSFAHPFRFVVHHQAGQIFEMGGWLTEIIILHIFAKATMITVRIGNDNARSRF